MDVNRSLIGMNANHLMSWFRGNEENNSKIQDIFWIHVDTGELSNEKKEQQSEWIAVSLTKQMREVSFEMIEPRQLSETANNVYRHTQELFADLSRKTDHKDLSISIAIPENVKYLAMDCFGEEKCAVLKDIKIPRQFVQEIEKQAKERLESPEPLTEKEISTIAKLFSSLSIDECDYLKNPDPYHPAFVFSQLHQALKDGVNFETTSEDPTSENRFAGNNESYFLLDKDKKRLWVFKPESGENSGLKGIPAGKGAIREHVAALLNSHRKFPIPYTAYVTINGKAGSVQLYVPDCKKFSTLRCSPVTRKELDELPANSFHALLTFDLLFSNCDRNGANILCRGEEIVGIDHGGCMTASAEDPICMEYLTLRQVAHQPFSHEMREFILNELDIRKDSGIMRKHGIEEDAIKWMETAATILQEAIKMSEKSYEQNEIFLSPGDIAIAVIKLREEIWNDPSPKYIQMVFSELLSFKSQIVSLHKQNKLTRATLDKIKTNTMGIIKTECNGKEYQNRVLRLNLFFNKILPNFCNHLTGEDFNPD